ncbi:hypothetical protein QQP08_003142, partial [Theobroma cacao]
SLNNSCLISLNFSGANKILSVKYLELSKFSHNFKSIHYFKSILCGMNDAETKPVLFCSCNDNTVRLYDLPSFTERGRLYSKREVRVIHRGPFPLFFTGDGSGSITGPGGGAPWMMISQVFIWIRCAAN